MVRFNDRIVEPIPANVAVYDDYFGICHELYRCNRAPFDRYPMG